MNKIVVGLIIIIILILISYMVIGFVNNAIAEAAEIKKLAEAAEIKKLAEAAEIKKLAEAAVDIMRINLTPYDEQNPQTLEFTTIPTIYEDEIAYIKGEVQYAREQNENYLSILAYTHSMMELNDNRHRDLNYMALLKLDNNNHNWKCGDTFEAYVKVLPYSEYYRILYPVDEYMPRGGLWAKFSGDDLGVGGRGSIPHFEEVKMMSIDSKNQKCMRK
jgi:hypothetical protein